MSRLDAQVEWISRLVAFDTSSGRSNLPLTDDVEDWLTAQGVRCRRVKSPDGTKANLYAVVGPDQPGGILLSGHSDVVPVTGQAWDTDPWTATLKDGRLYGRGTCDMKGFCGTALSLVPEFLAAPLARPLILAFSYDEEIGCIGAPAMIEEIVTSVPRPAAVIVGEPTMMRVVSGHKGSAQFRTTVTGIPAHSSETEQGVSAVEIAARLIAGIAKIRASNKRRAPADSPFSPPYSSLVSNLIQGGVQQNIIAGECTFRWEMRLLPGDDVATVREPFDALVREMEAEMHLVGPGAAVETVQVTSVPPLAPRENDEAVELARALTGANQLNFVSYASEAGQFQQAGFPTAICGPGSIDDAHKANEFVALDQIERCATFIRKLIPRLV
jgi:acetylornithine deacetylase